MPFPVGAAIGLGTSIFGGLFGGPDTIDSSRYMQQANKFNSIGNSFLDPNSKFYTESINRQKQSLLDIYLAGTRQKKQQLASQGINSNAINNINTDAASIRASEGANQFGVDLRRQGVGFSQGFFGLGNQANQQYLNAEQFNAGAGNSFKDQVIGGGLGLLGMSAGNGSLDSWFSNLFGGGGNNFTPGQGGPFGGQVNNPYGGGVPKTNPMKNYNNFNNGLGRMINNPYGN